MLKPLNKIYKESIFENPANHKFGWVGAEKSTVILLQDFRWSKDLITWKDFLLLLEGENVRLPAPRNLYKSDVNITENVAIFATGKSEIKYRGSYNMIDEREDEMIKSRWRVFKFHHQFNEAEQKKVEACPACFVKFMFD